MLVIFIETYRPSRNLCIWQVQLLNYRGDGTPFWNHLHIAPIRNHQGGLAHFVGIQLDVTNAPAPVNAGEVLHSTVRATLCIKDLVSSRLWIRQLHSSMAVAPLQQTHVWLWSVLLSD